MLNGIRYTPIEND